MNHKFTIKALKSAITSLALIVIFIILKSLANSEYIGILAYSIISGIIILLVFFMTLVGFIYMLKAKEEPRTSKKIIAIVLNSILMALMIVTIINIIIEFINYYKSH